MKIRSAEFLALVAIVTSATVMQVREHMQDTTAAHATPAAACGAIHNGRGLLPAACEATRDTTQREHADKPAQQPLHRSRIWV